MNVSSLVPADPYARKWALATLLIVVVDTAITAAAVESGMAQEANPVLRPWVHGEAWTLVVAAKAVVMATAMAVWYAAEDGRFKDLTVNFAVGIGLLAVTFNSVMILIEVTLT